MQLLRHKLLITGVTVAAAASAGGAYAATQSGTNSRQAFINDVAKRLNVTPSQLTAAVKGALLDRLNAAVKAGEITQAQANRIEQEIKRSGRLPFLFAPPGRLGPGHGLFERRAGGMLHVAASYLGLTNLQLLNDLSSGQSLAQIAKARNKSVSGLEQALITAEKTRLGRLQADGVITKAQEQRLLSRISARINHLVNRSGFGRLPKPVAPRLMPPGGPPWQGGAPGNGPIEPAGPGAPPPPTT